MMNATRWRLYDQVKGMGLPVEGGSGGRTKQQRIARGLPKEHYYDALCVGESTPEHFTAFPAYVQIWAAKGRGSRQRCRTDAHGLPIRHLSRKKRHLGFRRATWSKRTNPAARTLAPGPDASPHVLTDGLS